MSTDSVFNQLREFQTHIEEFYGAYTGLDVRDFVRLAPNFKALGELLVVQNTSSDLDVALILDRDLFSASSSFAEVPEHQKLAVAIEEVSHFVYLSFNHARGRNITRLEMESQSEIDRILVAGKLQKKSETQDTLLPLQELQHKAYTTKTYEESRLLALKFLNRLSNPLPNQWTAEDCALVRKFFHSDLGQKFYLGSV